VGGPFRRATVARRLPMSPLGERLPHSQPFDFVTLLMFLEFLDSIHTDGRSAGPQGINPGLSEAQRKPG